MNKQRKSVKLNYIYNVLHQILIISIPIITTPYLSRVLKPDGIGVVSFTESVVSYFVIFATMGISVFGQREISYVQELPERRSLVFWNIKLLEFFTSGLVLIVYIIYVICYKKSILYIVLSLNLLSVFFDVTWFFQGLEEFGKTVFRNILFKILNLLFVFTFIKDKDDVVLYALGHVIFNVLGNISLWFYLPKYLVRIRIVELNPFKNIGAVLSLFIPTIAIQIYTVLDKTMIGLITHNEFQNGYYEQAIKISKITLTLVTALGTVVAPRIGLHLGKGEQKKVYDLMYRGYRFVLFLGLPLCFGLILISDLFVPWFFGEGYNEVSMLLKILPLIIIFIGISNITGYQYLIPAKKQTIFTLTVVVGAIVNFSLNLLLIPSYQARGAAIASVIAEFLVTIVQLVALHKEIKFFQILKEGRKYYLATVIMIFVIIIIKPYLQPCIFHTLICVAIGMFSYCITLFIERDKFFINNVKNILKMLQQV